jgi:hypothetical protein
MICHTSASCDDSRQPQDSEDREARGQRAAPEAVKRVAPSQRPGILVRIE